VLLDCVIYCAFYTAFSLGGRFCRTHRMDTWSTV